jgi:phytoene synthase
MTSLGKLVRKSQASLFWCMRGLPKAQREAVYTLYAFCRHIDNITEGDLPQKEKQQILKTWQEELNNIYVKKVPATEIGRKIYKNCMRFKIKQEDFCEILNNDLLDFSHPLQAPTTEVFYKYIHGVAEIPAYITLLIMGGLEEEQMRELAQNYGRAMQLTNVLKDIKEDAQAGHLYLPLEFLQEAHIETTDPLVVLTDPHLVLVRERLAKQVASYFSRAFEMLNLLQADQTRPLRFILHIYKRYFDIMQKRGWEIMSPKPEISKRDKLAIVFNVLFDKK